MKRGDLHRTYITGSVPLQKVGAIFHRFIGSVPFFEYRFLANGKIVVVIPHRLRRIITTEQLNVWQDCYQWLVSLCRIQYSLAAMNQKKSVIGLRLKLLQFFVAFHQIAIWQIEAGLFEFVQHVNRAKTLQDLIDSHAELVAVLEQVSMRPFGQVATHIDGILRFGADFCRRGAQLDEDEVAQSEQQFNSFKIFLNGLLAVPARKEPAGLAASLLNAIR
jgi:hypothetical protein